MKSSILDTICSPQDVKELPFEQLDVLCTQIRERLIQTTAKTGGHLASNLGTVELTVALHVFLTARTTRSCGTSGISAIRTSC